MRKENSEALVAIVGEPNVGKSTLFNRIISRREALTSNISGTTRDRFYASTSWNGVDFSLIDTGGIADGQKGQLEKEVQKQVQIALSQADIILYVLDGSKPPRSAEKKILKMLRGQKKDIVLAVNKIDSPRAVQTKATEYKFTGIKQIFAVSAISGLNVGDMLDSISTILKRKGFGKTAEEQRGITDVSIVGKPNVGKSFLFNSIIGEERVVVSDIPGTTRNVIDTCIEYQGKNIRLLDTAGLKKHEKRGEVPDIYAGIQAVRAIRKSDVCVLVIDAKAGITQQDQKIADEIVQAGKGLVLAANKIDLLSEKEKLGLGRRLPDYFPFLWWAPAVPVSAKTSEGIFKILDYAIEIKANREKKVSDGQLKIFLEAKLRDRKPQRVRDERIPKIFSLTQTGSNPPVFSMLVNKPSAIPMQFRKYIQNSIIKDLGFWGTPVFLRLEAKRSI